MAVIRGTLIALACAFVMAACADNPSIDGSKVPLITNPDCTQACQRLKDLCGYAPTGDQCTTTAGDGYCDTQFDTDHLACIGQAPSCQDAWNCANAEAPADDAGDETATDDGPTE